MKQRIIKFRAWDKRRKRFVHVEEIDFLLEEINKPHELDGITLSFDDLKLMQFTGLFDKNGKEIYEGDVLQFPFREKLEKSVVKEHSPDYCYWMSLPLGGREFEVIGNIYENPELLEGNKE